MTRLTPQSAMVLRLLLVVDIALVAAVGTVSALFVERPAGLVGAALALVAVLSLLAILPRTDPYRAERRRASFDAGPRALIERTGIPVWISTGGTSLESALAEEFEITTSVDDARIAVLDDDRVQLQQVRSAHPELFIIAVVAGTSPHHGSDVVVSLLSSGADRCLVSPHAAEVAAQMHAVARRMGMDAT